MDNNYALGPLDGRYTDKVKELCDFFSEAALIKYRARVEIEWFIFLIRELGLIQQDDLTDKQLKSLRSLYISIDSLAIQKIKQIEEKIKHDVKAVEYFIRESVIGTEFEKLREFIHFGCTSEDINNIAYALMIKESTENVLLPVMADLIKKIYTLARQYKSVPMMSRTHGQPASPTTVGKEFIIFVDRLKKQWEALKEVKIRAKLNGAVGNFNAHAIAFPDISWPSLSNKFIRSLGLENNEYTTQIESHDYMAEFFDTISRFNTILLGFNRDLWSYLALGYFSQNIISKEVGSSTMPHKVNPINFENSEGNLGISNALLNHFSRKLPLSRMQRDLSDSTVLRNIGYALGYSLVAYKSCLCGLRKIVLNSQALSADLELNLELLAEPVQTILRKNRIAGAYELLKNLTRGKIFTKDIYEKFVRKLNIPVAEKNLLLELTPASYTGFAEKLVDQYTLVF